jgi:hypothetical protein
MRLRRDEGVHVGRLHRSYASRRSKPSGRAVELEPASLFKCHLPSIFKLCRYSRIRRLSGAIVDTAECRTSSVRVIRRAVGDRATEETEPCGAFAGHLIIAIDLAERDVTLAVVLVVHSACLAFNAVRGDMVASIAFCFF